MGSNCRVSGYGETRMFCRRHCCTNTTLRTKILYVLGKIQRVTFLTSAFNTSANERFSISTSNQLPVNTLKDGIGSGYRQRPLIYNVDAWSTGREIVRGVELTLRPTPKKCRSFTCTIGENRVFLFFVFFTHRQPAAFLSDAWEEPLIFHRPSC